MFANDNVVCTAPWYEIRINADGTVSYCHHAIGLREQTAESFVTWFKQGEYNSAVRAAIQNGEPVTHCNECYRDEALGQISHRHRKNFQGAIYQAAVADSLRQSPAYGRMQHTTVDKLPSFIHVSLSNLCNLSCRMCKPEFSTNLQQTLRRAQLIDTPLTVQDWTQGPRWQEFLDLVLTNPNLISVHFMGGEPMLHERFCQFVDVCIEKNKTDFDLSFVTNGTFLTPKRVDQLLMFRSLQIEISVENFHRTNNYIRQGSDVEQVKANILNILSQQPAHATVMLRTVFQALSAEHYVSLLQFALEHNINIDNNTLLGNEFLHAKILPTHIKEKIKQDLAAFKHRLPISADNYGVNTIRNRSTVINDLHRVVDSVVAVLNEPEPEHIQLLRQQFVKYNRAMDAVSTHQFADFYPNLVDFYAQQD